MSDAPLCIVDGCDRPPGKRTGGVCYMHHWRRRRGLPMNAEPRRTYETRRELLEEAVFVYLECKPTDDEAWRKAWNRLRVAARRFVLHTKR